MRCYSPIKRHNPHYGLPTDTNLTQFIEVPCGRCFACIERRRSHWTYRIEQEMKVSQSAYFVTLTYDEDHYVTSVNKRDPQLWLKSLRKAVSKVDSSIRLRYYLVSEYGSKTHRPHYHLILFNLPPCQLDLISKTWSHGFTYTGTVTSASIRYVTKYCTKASIDKTFVETHQVEKPFSLMSRRPAIGSNYLSKDMIKWHKDDLRTYVADGKKKVSIPRYYKDKIFDDVERLQIRLSSDDKDSYRDGLMKCYPDGDPSHFYEGVVNHAKTILKRVQNLEKL